eukprot:scaffold274085_cov28-Tisochrysis_lutea.AAC.1
MQYATYGRGGESSESWCSRVPTAAPGSPRREPPAIRSSLSCRGSRQSGRARAQRPCDSPSPCGPGRSAA